MSHEELSMLVKVQAPRIARPMRKNFETVLDRIVSPNASSQIDSVLFGCTWFAYRRSIENTLGAIEPSVWPPYQAIESLVGIPKPESIQEDLGRSIWNIIPIAIGDE
jgi:hypothetical protein